MKKIALVIALVAGQMAVSTQALAGRHHHHHGGGGVAGAIIGLGIGIAIGNAISNDNDGPDWVCRAHNARGESFRAVGVSRRHAANKVMDKCYSYSRKCWVDSCTERW